MKKLIGSIIVLGGLVLGTTFCRAEVNQDGYQITDLQIGFPLTVAAPNGSIRVLIPTATDAAALTLGNNTNGAWNGGLPVIDGLTTSLTAAEVAVICPANGSDIQGLFDFGDRAGEKLGSVFYDEQNQQELTLTQAQGELAAGREVIRYLGFLCRYQGSGAISEYFSSQELDRNIQITNLISPLIPPGQNAGTLNQAVVLPAKIQLFNSGDLMLSSRDVLLSTFTQAVRVSANIDLQLTFRLEGIAAGEPVCDDQVTTVASQALQVNYGQLPVGSFVDAAQRLSVISSAPQGYVITVAQNHPLARQGSVCSPTGMQGLVPDVNCIPNYGWQSNLAPTAAAAWINPLSVGFGYTTSVSATAVPGNPQVATIFNNGAAYTRLASADLGEPAVVLASSDTLARRDFYDVCYRVAIDGMTATGIYTNNLIYTLTASF
jgi:hypothetical protein